MNAKQERIKPTTKEGSDPIKRLLLLFLITLLITLPVASASSAYNITVTSKYVKATAKCSCGSSTGTYHTYHIGTFLNYCPQCHHHNCLIWNPKGTVEGEWTCKYCDCDYCAGDGKEKISGSDLWLRYYHVSKAKPVSAKNATCSKNAQVQLTPVEVVMSKLHLNMLLNG